MSPEQENDLLRIGRDVAMKSRLTDKEEAYSVALLGVAKGLNTYVPDKKVKLTTYLYQCAKFECWAEWRKQHRLKRGRGQEDISLDELHDRGIEL